MPISVSTDTVRPSERQAFWTDAVCRSFASVDTRPLCPGEISGRFEVHEIGSARIARFDTSPQSYSRDARLVSSAASDDFMFDFQLAGRSCVIQGAHEGRVRPGYGVLYDARRPFEDFLDRCSGHDAEVLMVTVPARPLLAAFPDAERLCAVPLPLSGAVRRATAQHLHSLVVAPAGRPRQRGPAEDDIVAHLAALLRLATGGALALSRGRLFSLLDAHVRQTLGEAQSPEGLATLFGISERTLHRIFADEHTTLERHLLRLRAGRLRELLSQPRWSKVSIGNLAIECGFADAAHASRAFRAYFDETPRDCRSRALRSREDQS